MATNLILLISKEPISSFLLQTYLASHALSNEDREGQLFYSVQPLARGLLVGSTDKFISLKVSVHYFLKFCPETSLLLKSKY